MSISSKSPGLAASDPLEIPATSARDERFDETVEARRHAGRLLSSLIAEHELLEARRAEIGQDDPMKGVRGRSAMENAISSTREMIAVMDRLLERMRRRGGRMGEHGHA